MTTHTLPATAGTPHINLLGFECGLHMGPPIVHAASGTELFGESFHDALKRIDEFSEPGRTLLLDLQAALERVAQVAPRSPLVFQDSDPFAYRLASRSEPSALACAPLQRRPASPAMPAATELASLRRVEAKLRRGGANLPAPAAQGTIESAIATGLSVALALVDDEIAVLTRDAELAAATTVMTPSALQAWEQRRADLRGQVGSSRVTPHHTGVRADEIAQLLDDLERVGTKATGEMIGICGQAAAVINALLTGLSVEQLA